MTMAAKDTSGTIPYTTIDNISSFLRYDITFKIQYIQEFILII